MNILWRRRFFLVVSATVTLAPLLWSSAFGSLRVTHQRPLPVSLSAATATSPPDKMLVVTTNLRAAWGDQSDMPVRMKRYVHRLLNQTPYFPDALMLQEVKRRSARRVAALLSNRTGNDYIVAVRPPRIPWSETPKIHTETDSAIVIDRTTTKKLDPGGFISLKYKRSDAADPKSRVEVNRHARLSVEERSGGLRMSLASVHFQYKKLKNRSLWRTYQKKWAQKVAKKLATKYPGTTHTVGGDFNRTRCITPGGAAKCTKNPFWRVFVRHHHYRDVIYKLWREGKKHLGLGGVDFIFTKGTPLKGRIDRYYNKNDASTFYSDHHFVWGLISAR